MERYLAVLAASAVMVAAVCPALAAKSDFDGIWSPSDRGPPGWTVGSAHHRVVKRRGVPPRAPAVRERGHKAARRAVRRGRQAADSNA